MQHFRILYKPLSVLHCLIFACVIVSYPSANKLKAIEHHEYNNTLIGLSGGYGIVSSMAPEPISGYSADDLKGLNTFYVACSVGKWNGIYVEGRFSRSTMTLTEEPAPFFPPDNVGNLDFYSTSIRLGYELAPIGEHISATGFGYRIGLGLGYQFIDFKEGSLVKTWERELGVDFKNKFSPVTIVLLSTGVEMAITKSVSLTAEAEYLLSHTNWTITVDIPYADDISQRAKVNASSLSFLFGMRVWFIK